MILKAATPADTFALGQRLAKLLQAGDLVILNGPLGAGKTVLVQGIGAGLGVAGDITSPTFVIARIHRGAPPLVHVDAYRLASFEIDDLDLDTPAEEAVTVVEWGKGKVERLASSYLEVRIERLPDDTRHIELVPHAGAWPARLSHV